MSGFVGIEGRGLGGDASGDLDAFCLSLDGEGQRSAATLAKGNHNAALAGLVDGEAAVYTVLNAVCRADVAARDIRIVRRLDMRYQGQGHEIEVTLPDGASVERLFAELPELFAQVYEKAYSLRLDEPMEIVNWKIEAIGPAPSLGEGYSLTGAAGVGATRKGTRLAYDPACGTLVEWPVYDRYALAPGMSVSGPALIEERESTAVVGAGDTVTVDARYNLVAELAGS